MLDNMYENCIEMVARCGHMVGALDGVGAERNGHDSGMFNEMSCPGLYNIWVPPYVIRRINYSTHLLFVCGAHTRLEQRCFAYAYDSTM